MRLDNVKLYEKIKFLQNYRGSGSTQFKSTFNDDEAGRKYANQYEEQLDPFSKVFKRKTWTLWTKNILIALKSKLAIEIIQTGFLMGADWIEKQI